MAFASLYGRNKSIGRGGRHAICVGACITVLATAITVPASASTQSDSYRIDVGRGVQTVTYLGRGFVVPSSWKVIDLTAHPSACVRFDVHAVYLGHPGTAQQCPAHGAGRHTGALLIEPDLTRTTSGTVTAYDHPISNEIDVTAPGLTVTAGYGDDRTIVVGALTAAGLPPPVDASMTSAGRVRDIEPVEVVRGTNQVTGLGFDTCAAPSAKQMDAWAASPFSTIGIYIGGSERACAQPNLTESWIVARARAGWHFMPLYVGWQAAWDKLTATASTPGPAALGIESADDAITEARSLGIGPGALLYYDMESYTTRAQSAAAMSFLSWWTAELHSRGYRSAVYSSAGTGIADLVANRGRIAEPDVVAIAHWNGIPDATPADAWPVQRAHQYIGNVNASYGGVKLNIDKDYLSIDNVTPITGVTSAPKTPTATPSASPSTSPSPSLSPSQSSSPSPAPSSPSAFASPTRAAAITTSAAPLAVRDGNPGAVRASCPIASVSTVPGPGSRASNRLVAC